MLSMEGACWLCHQPLKLISQGVCSFCLKSLPLMPNCCPRCALPSEQQDVMCGRCLKQPPAWQRLVTVTPYQAPLRKLIHRYKFNSQSQLAFALARIFVLHWLNGYRQMRWPKPDMIVTIPLHPNRLWQRGFDHVAFIGEYLARWLNITYSRNSLLRTRDTLTQITLKRKYRHSNLNGAFSLTTSVTGRQVAILDDVITTGATMQAAAQLLICAGVQTVEAWSVCRTL
ncbi:phosphoribosyltransferase family protein [Providencia burhodogranariea]|uniref:Periplasmic gluconate-binding protein in GNT I transport system n=1 Tax=Providencia burhodogranariea DSM 19968 TaxID=1141662 RepID=K8WLZ3_9GAMM|nr:phosphoribosyltransferase family protein [Providencia burhodogranariea]EKT57190.1 periplasmic gluconate-binding protein in GNT I transport system [Providencia burhodogranariea DSM 19968]